VSNFKTLILKFLILLVPLSSLVLFITAFQLLHIERVEQFQREFESNNFFELSSSDVYLIARKLDALSKKITFSCLNGYRNDALFFQLNSTSCKPSLLKPGITIYNPPANDVRIDVLLSPSKRSLNYLIIFIFFQFVTLSTMFLMIRHSERSKTLKNKNELELSAALGKLASQLAHDIRSPLAALKVLGPSLENVSSDQSELFHQVTKRIQEIAQKLLDLSRTSESKTPQRNPLLFEKFKVAEAIEKVFKEVSITIPKTIILNLIPPLLEDSIRADESQFLRAVTNILVNAVQAIPPAKKGAINVIVKNTKKLITIEIKDNGIGIKKEHLKSIGNYRFTQVKIDGSGLGLSFAKDFFRSINGKLSIQSKLGIGTTVTITLPAAS